MLINGTPIIAGDIVASNGIVHVIGDVLLPPS
ncbi:MAG: fasciclin domain-containing protein [Ilumatobacteraceae bacterium]